MSASLPMYWRPETASAWQHLWDFVRSRIGKGPQVLQHPDDLHAHWRDPGLVLSQTCSLPLRTGLAPHVHVLGAFDFGLPATPAGGYHSVVLTGPGALPDAPRVAINGADSQSGWAALCDWSGGDVSGPIVLIGAHLDSARMVARGAADLCAVDGVTWDYIARFEPEVAARLRILARTAATPGLPLITGDADLVAPLRAALRDGVGAMSPEDRRATGVQGFVVRTAAPYLALPIPPAPVISGALPPE